MTATCENDEAHLRAGGLHHEQKGDAKSPSNKHIPQKEAVSSVQPAPQEVAQWRIDQEHGWLKRGNQAVGRVCRDALVRWVKPHHLTRRPPRGVFFEVGALATLEAAEVKTLCVIELATNKVHEITLADFMRLGEERTFNGSPRQIGLSLDHDCWRSRDGAPVEDQESLQQVLNAGDAEGDKDFARFKEAVSSAQPAAQPAPQADRPPGYFLPCPESWAACEALGAPARLALWAVKHTTREIARNNGQRLGLVAGGAAIRVEEIAAELEVSVRTLRRALRALAGAGILVAIRGGQGLHIVVPASQRRLPRGENKHLVIDEQEAPLRLKRLLARLDHEK